MNDEPESCKSPEVQRDSRPLQGPELWQCGTLDEIARIYNNTQTLEPYERVEMFATKKRMTFLLRIFYQWRGIAKLGLNQEKSDQKPVRRKHEEACMNASEYFTFNQKSRKK